MTPLGQALRIGVVSDGKAGHRNQSLGLAEALLRLYPGSEVLEIDAMSRISAMRAWLAPSRVAPDCDLLIGAGHGTHLTLLALRRAIRAPVVVLMRPSLPGAFFDLRIEPRHDGGSESRHCWISEGPLNRMQPAAERTGGLILIGGPSPHFQWDDARVIDQLERICDGGTEWELSTSRRTPDGFTAALRERALPRLSIHEVQSLPSGWLSQQLPRCEYCWVTPDSASMLYEALTAGSAVGVIDLPPTPGSRVASAVADLEQRGLVTSFDAFAGGRGLEVPATPLAEADRIARRLRDEGWLS